MRLVGHRANMVTGWYDENDSVYPIEIGVNDEYACIKPKQALELAEFLIATVEKINNKEKTGGTL